MSGPDGGSSARATDRREVEKDKRGTQDRGGNGLERGTQADTASSAARPAVPTSPGTPLRQQLEAINVWSFRVFHFRPNKAGGWSHTIHFDKLTELLKKLEDEKLHGRVNKFVIVAHGDKAGLVKLNKDLTTETLESFAADLTTLGKFLTPDGKLLFESCQAGAGEGGSLLLVNLSKLLKPEQTVVGYIVNGLGPGPGGGLAGDIFEAPKSMPGMAASQFKGSKRRMTEESFYAKWARGGKIVRLSLLEEFEKRRGTWIVGSWKGPGKMSAQYSGATFEIRADDFTVSRNGKSLTSGSYKADFTKRPRIIDIDYKLGADRGKKAVGILEFGEADFDVLRILLTVPATETKERPADFAYVPDAPLMLIELKRAPPRN